jgi:hypothetical protein
MTAGTRVDDANVTRPEAAAPTPDAGTDGFNIELTAASRDHRCNVQLFHSPAVDTDAVQIEVFNQVRQLHTVYIYSNLHRCGYRE